MKRHLVVTSSTLVRATLTLDVDAAVELAAAGERKRLEAYLYGHSTLAAVAHDVKPDGFGTHRLEQRALVVVEGDKSERTRYLADYQADRLRSGSFGVEDYVEDELHARIAVLGDQAAIPSDEVTLADALEYAASCLASEEVEYALGLDEDHLESSYVLVDGLERPRTEADLADELARHRKIVELLAGAAKTAGYR
jgi:hypothetical protein